MKGEPCGYTVSSFTGAFAHDDVIKWKHFPRYWPFVRGIHRPGEFSAQRSVPRSFSVFFDLRLNERLSKQWWGWWFETLSRSLWRHRNESTFSIFTLVTIIISCSYLIWMSKIHISGIWSMASNQATLSHAPEKANKKKGRMNKSDVSIKIPLETFCKNSAFENSVDLWPFCVKWHDMTGCNQGRIILMRYHILIIWPDMTDIFHND